MREPGSRKRSGGTSRADVTVSRSVLPRHERRSRRMDFLVRPGRARKPVLRDQITCPGCYAHAYQAASNGRGCKRRILMTVTTSTAFVWRGRFWLWAASFIGGSMGLGQQTADPSLKVKVARPDAAAVPSIDSITRVDRQTRPSRAEMETMTFILRTQAASGPGRCLRDRHRPRRRGVPRGPCGGWPNTMRAGWFSSTTWPRCMPGKPPGTD